MNRFLLFSFLALFFVALGLNSLAGTEVKTLELMVDQANGATVIGGGAGGEFWNTRTIKLVLPESSISVQSAWIEVEIYTNNTSDYNLLVVQFPRDTNVLVYPPIAYVWDQSGEQGIIVFKANVTSFFSGKSFPLDVNGAVSILGNSVRNNKMKLFITYTYDDTSAVEMKTIKYPLDTNITAAGASTKRTYNFDFNAKIADYIGTAQAFVQIYAERSDSSALTDGNMTPRIGTNAFSSNLFYIRTTGSTSFDVDYLFDINDTFSANTQQAIDVNFENSISTTQRAATVGGEVVIDYNADATAARQTKTVSYFMHQDVNKDRTNRINFSKIINLPETGVTVRALYAKIYAGNSTASGITLTVDANVGSTAATQRVYSTLGTSTWAGENIIINDLNEAMSGLVGQTDTNISINTQYNGVGGIPVGIELYITYDYDGNSTTQQKTVGYFAGMNPTSKSTDYNATLSVFVKEASASRKSAWLVVDHYTTTADTTVGDYNITTDINAGLGSFLLVSQEADGENRTGHSLNGDASSVVTAVDKNYVINYKYASSSSDDNVVMSGKLFLTYNFAPPVAADYSFALSMPSSGCTQGKGSYDAGGTCDRGYFEPTDLDGNSDQTKVDPEGQTSTIPFFIYDNQSTTSSDLNVYMDLNSALPPTFVLKASKVYTGWSYSCSGNTDTNCVQVDVNGTGVRELTPLEDLFIFCPGGCIGGVNSRIYMKFDIRSISPAATITGAALQLNVIEDSTNDNCAFYHLDQNQGWTENDSAANIYAMHTGTSFLSGASLCYSGTGDSNFAIKTILTPAVSQRDQNFSLRYEDQDSNDNAPADTNNTSQLQSGNASAGKIFASSESSNSPKLFVTYDANSQNLGKATYTTGTQDFNIFVWADFINASQGLYEDRNAASTSKSPT